ncbi:MAG: hypothetical protein ABIM99_06195 [Candidatus Dojkabacteria bacterium]
MVGDLYWWLRRRRRKIGQAMDRFYWRNERIFKAGCVLLPIVAIVIVVIIVIFSTWENNAIHGIMDQMDPNTIIQLTTVAPSK